MERNRSQAPQRGRIFMKLSAALVLIAVIAAFGYIVGRDLALRDDARDAALRTEAR